MSPDFKWRTEEGSAWDDGEVEVELSRPPIYRRRVTLGLVFAVLLSSAILFLARYVTSRLESIETDVETEVMASHEVIHRAAYERDLELFANFLSGRDPEWSVTYEKLLREGGVFDRRGLGLAILPVANEESKQGASQTVVEEIVISPDLSEAEVITQQAYAIEIGNNLTETVRLRQHAIYRLGPNRWLYSPRADSDAYWGEWITREHRFLTVTYHKRDEAWVTRLASDIERRLASFCGSMRAACPGNLHVELHFDSHPESLLRISKPDQIIHVRGEIMVLPTPTIVGEPVDEAAYRALYRGYAIHVMATVLVNEAWDWPCCSRPPLFEALLDRELSNLRLTAWPVSRADYVRLQTEGTSLQDLVYLWERESPVTDPDVHALALVEFLQRQNPAATTELMVAALQQEDGFWDWLELVTGDRHDLPQQWEQFVNQQAKQ